MCVGVVYHQNLLLGKSQTCMFIFVCRLPAVVSLAACVTLTLHHDLGICARLVRNAAVGLQAGGVTGNHSFSRLPLTSALEDWD